MTVLPSLLICLLLQAVPLPAGTAIDARLESAIKTATSAIGDEVFAVMTHPVRGPSQVIIPKGARLTGRVEIIQQATADNEGRVRIVFREIRLPDGRNFRTWITDSFQAMPPKQNRR